MTRKPFWVEVEIKTDILFPERQRRDPAAKRWQILDGIAEILKPLPSPIRIEGHTDNRPIKTPQFPSNWELSGARASRIVRLFESRGIEPARMSVAGEGEYQPVADNGTAEGRNRNRRVTLVILDTMADEAAVRRGRPPSAGRGSGLRRRSRHEPDRDRSSRRSPATGSAVRKAGTSAAAQGTRKTRSPKDKQPARP